MGPLLHGLKLWGGWVVGGGGGGGLEQFSVSPRPLGFGFGTKGFGAKGLGPGLDNYFDNNFLIQSCMFLTRV